MSLLLPIDRIYTVFNDVKNHARFNDAFVIYRHLPEINLDNITENY